MSQLASALVQMADSLDLPRSDVSVPAADGPRFHGIGVVARLGGLLLRGVRVSLDDGNVYAAASLLRQLVEVEYLAWAFAEDLEEARSWLESTKDERLSRWQPRHLRNRSSNRFRGKDYANHCEQGGHPTPDGHSVLIGGRANINGALLTCDALTHGRSLWTYLMDAVIKGSVQIGAASDDLVPHSTQVAGNTAVESWWAFDPFRPFIEMKGSSELNG